jgi:uncharacterized membrane protein
METLFAVLHVVAAVFIIGPMAILPMAGLRSLRSGNSAQVTGFARATNVFGWLSLVVAVFGFGLVAFVDPEDKLTYTTPWLLTSIILYAAAVTVVLSGVAPLMKRAGERLADGKLAMEYRPIAALSGLSALLLVAVVVLMVWRP